MISKSWSRTSPTCATRKQGDIWTARLQGYLTANFPHLGRMTLPGMMIQLYAMACRIQPSDEHEELDGRALFRHCLDHTVVLAEECASLLLRCKVPCAFDRSRRVHSSRFPGVDLAVVHGACRLPVLVCTCLQVVDLLFQVHGRQVVRLLGRR